MLLRLAILATFGASVIAIDHPLNITYSDMDGAIVWDPIHTRSRLPDQGLSDVPNISPLEQWLTLFSDKPEFDQPPIMNGSDKTGIWASGISSHRTSNASATMTLQGVYSAVYVWGKYQGNPPFKFQVDNIEFPAVQGGPRLVDSIPDAPAQSDAVLIASATGLDLDEHQAALSVNGQGLVEIMNVTITTIVSSDAKDISKTDTAKQYTIREPFPITPQENFLQISKEWQLEVPSELANKKWGSTLCKESDCGGDLYPVVLIYQAPGATATVQTPENASLVHVWGQGDILGVGSYSVEFSPRPPYGSAIQGSLHTQWPNRWSRMATVPLDPTKRYNMTVTARDSLGYLNIHGATYLLSTCNNCSPEELAPGATTNGSSTAVPGSETSATQGRESTAKSKGSTNAGAIAGGVVGGIVGLALLILLFVCWRRQQRKKKDVPRASSFKNSDDMHEHEDPAPPPHLVPFQRATAGEPTAGLPARHMASASPKATYTPRSAAGHSHGESSMTGPSTVLSPGSSSGSSQPNQAPADWQETDAGPMPGEPQRLVPPSYNTAWRGDDTSAAV